MYVIHLHSKLITKKKKKNRSQFIVKIICFDLKCIKSIQNMRTYQKILKYVRLG